LKTRSYSVLDALRAARTFTSFATVLASLTLASPALAGGSDDIVFLKGGGRARGLVIEESPTTGVRVKLADGSVKVYANKDVDHIEYGGGGGHGSSAPATAATPAAPAAPPSAASQSAANVRFQSGKKLAQSHRCREAIVEFQASLDLMPSPNTRLAMGRCYLEIGQIASAHVALERAANDARDRVSAGDTRYQTTADAASSEAQAVAPRVPHVTFVLSSNPPPTLILVLDGQPLPASAAGTPTEVDPGPHTLAVKGDGVRPHEQQFSAHEGQSESVSVAVEQTAGGAGGVAASNDAWSAAQAQAAELMTQRMKEREEAREAERKKKEEREKEENEAAEKRAPFRQGWRPTLGIDVGGAFASSVPFGSVMLSGSGLSYGGLSQAENLVGPMIDVAVGLRKSLSPKWEFVGALSLGTIRVDGVSSLGSLCSYCYYNGSSSSGSGPTASIYETSSASLDPVLFSSLALGARVFTHANGPFFFGFGALATLIRASGTITTTFRVTYDPSGTATSPAPDTASVNAVTMLGGAYVELGSWLGDADDWGLSARAALEANGTTPLAQVTFGLTKAFSLGSGGADASPSEAPSPEPAAAGEEQ
jgi:hypothetical protein